MPWTAPPTSPQPGDSRSVFSSRAFAAWAWLATFFTEVQALATTEGQINAAAEKTTPVDADKLGLVDSADGNALKKLTWANLKAAIKSYYDAATSTLTNKTIDTAGPNTIKVGGVDVSTAWTAFTPTITAGTGAFTTVSGSGAYKQIGKTVFLRVKITITTNGTAAASVVSSLPVAAGGASQSFGMIGRDTVAGTGIWGAAQDTGLAIQTFSNTYPGADGKTLQISGVYEAA